jgi:hypothetical protein
VRLWSLHPSHLDAKGLVALWREALLAQKVLEGRTRGYKNHPQLERFKNSKRPLPTLAAYLEAVRAEALKRGYNFKSMRIRHRPVKGLKLRVKAGQIAHEWKHLAAKLRSRDFKRLAMLKAQARPKLHPLFKKISGGVESWERP